MSTVIIFGYMGGPAGSTNARPIQVLVFDPVLGPQVGDPTGMPSWDTNGQTGGDHYYAGRPIDQVTPRPNAGVLTTVTLGARYWPAPTPAGHAREGDWSSSFVCGAGQSIVCSKAEAFALWCYGMIASH